MRQSAAARLIVMGALALSLLIPLFWVRDVVAERASRRESAIADISNTWGKAQVLAGPVLAVPFSAAWIDKDGRHQRGVHHAFVLPRDLRIDGHLATETRRRGIFEVPVYRGTVKVSGTFIRPSDDWIRPVPERVDWAQATLLVGVTDPRGIARRSTVTWAGQTLPLSGGSFDAGLFRTGLTTTVAGLADTALGTVIPFAFTLDLNGTRSFHVLPTADETVVFLNSPWRHPGFSGAPLPETRQVTASGFSAQWQVQDFGRPYGARWTSAGMNRDQLAQQAGDSAFGVSLVQPVDLYQQADRAVKYAVLFIVLTFLVFFLWEILGAKLLHPVHYTFVGFAMCVFYLLLVSISEHTGFDLAYAVSSVVTTALIAGYARAVFGGLRQGGSVAVALSGLYGFLYLLLRLEDYALLAGSIGVFLVLSLVMFMTRRMNWYELKLGEG